MWFVFIWSFQLIHVLVPEPGWFFFFKGHIAEWNHTFTLTWHTLATEHIGLKPSVFLTKARIANKVFGGLHVWFGWNKTLYRFLFIWHTEAATVSLTTLSSFTQSQFSQCSLTYPQKSPLAGSPWVPASKTWIYFQSNSSQAWNSIISVHWKILTFDKC